MEYKSIIYDRYGTDDRIGRITLNRPEKLNTLNQEILSELEECLRLAAWDDGVRVIVIRGAGRAFGAGYDLAPSPGQKPYEGITSRLTGSRKGLQEGARRQMFIFNLPKVIIAQVHGPCLGGAAGLALAIWFFFVLIFDLVLLGTLVASEGKLNPELLPWLLMLNPTDIYRLLNIVAFGDSGQLSGVLSLGADLPIGAAGLWLGLILWCAIPLAGALLLFKNRRI